MKFSKSQGKGKDSWKGFNKGKGKDGWKGGFSQFPGQNKGVIKGAFQKFGKGNQFMKGKEGKGKGKPKGGKFPWFNQFEGKGGGGFAPQEEWSQLVMLCATPRNGKFVCKKWNSSAGCSKEDCTMLHECAACPGVQHKWVEHHFKV